MDHKTIRRHLKRGGVVFCMAPYEVGDGYEYYCSWKLVDDVVHSSTNKEDYSPSACRTLRELMRALGDSTSIFLH